MMLSLFISYRRADSASLSQLLEAKLAKYGIRAYVDTRKVDSAGPFPDRLRKAIADADAFIVLLEANTLDSAWVLEEIRHAHALGKPMIPVFQERYATPQTISEPAVSALLQFDGVRILDISNLYVDEAIRQIAYMIPRKKQRNWLFAAGSIATILFLTGVIGLIILNGQREPETDPSANGMTLASAATGSESQVASPDSPTRAAAPSDAPDVAATAVDGAMIVQEFRNSFNSIVEHFGQDDCIGFTPDEQYVYGADWLYTFDNGEMVDDIDITYSPVISPDGTLAAVGDDALYSLFEKIWLFDIGGEPKFSADGSHIASDRVGVHHIASGRLVRNARRDEVYTAISPDGRYIVSQGIEEAGAAVIDLETREAIIEDEDGNGFTEAQFSPSGNLLAIVGVGVYEIPSGRLVVESEETGTTFSPDERFIAGGRAVVDITTGETVLELDPPLSVAFTPDSRFMVLQGNGVYDLPSMRHLFELRDTGGALSHNGQYVASQLTGWFHLPDGELFPIDDAADDSYYHSPPLFSADDQFVAFDGDGIYSVQTGRKLLHYAHDFVAFAPLRGLILVRLDSGECAMIGDGGKYSDAVPLE
jgi:hypothetical protein